MTGAKRKWTPGRRKRDKGTAEGEGGEWDDSLTR